MGNWERFRDRADAGRRLAAKLGAYAERADVIVLALPRGGVAVGYEAARALHAPLDVLVVRKVGVPGHEELAMGAVASGRVLVVNEKVTQALGISEAVLRRAAAAERKELERRERTYRGERSPSDVRERTVLLVDDGIATGSTMRAAIRALRALHPARIVVAVPTAPPDVCDSLRADADEVVAVQTPEPFIAIGLWYHEFPQLSDDDVRRMLRDSVVARPAGAEDSG